MIVSVIIVNWNVRELLRECLDSLLKHTALPPEQYEVIVVDNDSADGSAEMVRQCFPQVHLHASPTNLGFGAAHNAVLPLCRGRHLFLLNPDTRLLDDALSAMLAILEEDPGCGALGCRLLNADGSLQRWTAGALPSLSNAAAHALGLDRALPALVRSSLYLSHDVRQDRNVDWVSGACMLVRRSALGEGPLFDAAFFLYGEDMELCHRLVRAGYRVRYTPRVSIVHYQGASMRQQRGDVLLSSLRGPRQFFARTRGALAVRAYDLLTVLGFGIRWLAYGVLARVSRSEHWRAKTASSRHHLGIALQIARGR